MSSRHWMVSIIARVTARRVRTMDRHLPVNSMAL